MNSLTSKLKPLLEEPQFWLLLIALIVILYLVDDILGQTWFWGIAGVFGVLVFIAFL